MKKNPSLVLDAFLWVAFMALAAIVAFNLLVRDKYRNFGAVSYGSFPEFVLKMPEGKSFDRHQIKGYVWAVHTGPSADDAMGIARQLAIIAKQTVSGKRHLNVLTVSQEFASLKPLMPYHYIAGGNSQDISRMFAETGTITSSTVFLVDQNSIIRGRYDFKDVDQYRAFQRDLMRLL